MWRKDRGNNKGERNWIKVSGQETKEGDDRSKEMFIWSQLKLLPALGCRVNLTVVFPKLKHTLTVALLPVRLSALLASTHIASFSAWDRQAAVLGWERPGDEFTAKERDSRIHSAALWDFCDPVSSHRHSGTKKSARTSVSQQQPSLRVSVSVNGFDKKYRNALLQPMAVIRNTRHALLSQLFLSFTLVFFWPRTVVTFSRIHILVFRGGGLQRTQRGEI